MDELPDDVLVAVLQHLPVPDVLACRPVCKRLADLAVHRDVWRHRVVDKKDPCPWVCTVLRLAPCLRKLSLFVHAADCHSSLLTSTTCRVTELDLSVDNVGDAGGAAQQAALAIRHQEALGQLRSLAVGLVRDVLLMLPFAQPVEEPLSDADSGAGLLLIAMASTRGLLKLVVRDAPTCTASLLNRANNAVSEPSLKHFESYAPQAELFNNYIMRAHAATLERVVLLGFGPMTPFGNSTFTVTSAPPLLAKMRRLRKLTCPPLPGLQAVAEACDSLEEVILPMDLDTAESAEDFLLRCQQLRHLSISFRNPFERGEHLLLGGLAAGPSRATLVSLKILQTPMVIPVSDTWQRALLRALPLLPALRTLEMIAVPDELLLGITPETAPALRHLRLDVHCLRPPTIVPTCIHTWMHRESFETLLSVNPLLELSIFPWPVPLYCAADSLCPTCELGCHRSLLELVDTKTDRFEYVPIPRGIPV